MRGAHQVMLQMAKWRSRVGESLVQVDLGHTGRARLGLDLYSKVVRAWSQVTLPGCKFLY